MPRLILILTALLSLAGVALGFVNRGKFISVRTEKDGINREIETAIAKTDDTIDEIKKLFDKSEDIEAALDLARVGADETSRKAKMVTDQIASRDTGIKTAENKIAEMEAVIAGFEGITLETVNEDVADMEQEIETIREDVTGLEDIIRVAQNVVEKNRAALIGYREAQEKRSDIIALSSTEATITAVNNDWGFVVVNAGSNKGVPTDAELLIRRGSEQIGRLAIVSLEPNMLVANIVQDSLRPGVSVVPGDRVVFENDVN